MQGRAFFVARLDCAGDPQRRTRSAQIGFGDIRPEVSHLLRNDGERQKMLGMVHEFSHPGLGVVVALIPNSE